MSLDNNNISDSQNIYLLKKTNFFTGNQSTFSISTNIDINVFDVVRNVRCRGILLQKRIQTLSQLLNTSYNYFLTFKNCGKISISTTQKEIIKYFEMHHEIYIIANNKSEKHFIPDLNYNVIIQTPFFGGDVVISKNTKLSDIDISELELPIRCENVLKVNRIYSLFQLLNTKREYLLELRNCGITTIEKTQNIIIERIKSFKKKKQEYVKPTIEKNSSSFYLKNIVNFIFTSFNLLSEKQKEILFLRHEKKYTLQRIGDYFSLTRERVRQIYDNIKQNFDFSSLKQFYYDFFLKQYLKYKAPFDFSEFLPFGSGEQTFFTLRVLEGIIAIIFPELPLLNEPRQNKKLLNSELFTYLESIKLPFARVTFEDIFSSPFFTNKSSQQKLHFIKLVYMHSHYYLINYNGEKYIIRKSALPNMVNDILQGIDKPLKLAEILDIIRKYYKVSYSSFPSVLSQIKSSKKLYELDKHLIGLESHFGYSKEEWGNIHKKAEKILLEIGKPVYIAILYDKLKHFFPKIRSKYELVYVLRANKNFIDLGFFYFASRKLNISEFGSIKQIIFKIFDKIKKPLHSQEIFDEINKFRSASYESLDEILKKCDFLKSYGGRFWGLQKNDIKNKIYLLHNEYYINKILVYEIFPDVSVKGILRFVLQESNKQENNQSYEEILVETIRKSKFLFLYEDYQNQEMFIFSKNWSDVRIIKAFLYSKKNEKVFIDEIRWFFETHLNKKTINFGKVNTDIEIIKEGRFFLLKERNIHESEKNEIKKLILNLMKKFEEGVTLNQIYNYIANNNINISKGQLKKVITQMDQLIYIDDNFIISL